MVLALFALAACQPQAAAPAAPGAPAPTGLVVSCPSDGTTDGQLKVEETLASTTTFDDGPTTYFTSESVADVTGGALSTSDFSTAVDLECGQTYTPVAVTAADDIASVVGQSFTASGPADKKTLASQKIAGLQVKVKDRVSDQYLNISSKQTPTGSYSAFVHVGATGSTGTNATDYPGQSSLTIAADGYLDLRFDVKTNTTKARFGEEGLNTYLCVDADSDKWAEPQVSIGSSGVALSDVKESMKSNDQSALNNFEYCYNVGQITDIAKSIFAYQETASGVNPGTSDRPEYRFVAEGRYQSNKETDAQGDKRILVGAFQDDTSKTEVFSGNQQSVLMMTS